MTFVPKLKLKPSAGLVVVAKRPCERYCTSQAGATASIGVGAMPCCTDTWSTQGHITAES